MPRPRKLSESQARELVRRYYLYRENQPWKLAEDFGINKCRIPSYVRRHQKAQRA